MKRAAHIASLLLPLWVIVCGSAIAQSASVQGTVQDQVDRIPLAGCNVILVRVGTEDLVAGTATDATGRYMIADVEAGAYALIVRYVGYEEARIPLTLEAGTSRTVDVLLEPANLELNPVVVSVSRRQEKALDSPASISLIEASDIEQDVVPSTVVSLRNVAGVEMAQVGLDRYQVSLRGFNTTFASRTLALVDFRRAVFPGLLLNSFASMPIAPLDVAHIEVVRGPASALYGGGVEQGVIHFLTKDPFNHPGTTVQVGGGERSFIQGALRHAGVVNNKLGYKIVGSYSQGDDWRFDPDDPDDQVLFATLHEAFDGYDHNAWKGYGMGEIAYRVRPSITLMAQGGYASVKQIIYSNVGENLADDTPTAFGQLRLQAGPAFAQVSLSTSPGDNGIRSYRTNRLRINRSTDINVQAQYSLDLFQQRANIILGTDLRFFLLDTGGTLHGRNEGDNDYFEGGGYLHATAQLSNQLDLILASRLDHNSVLDATVFSPRAALVYKPTPGHSLRAVYNRAFSMPPHGAFFLDDIVADPGPFQARLRGNRDGWSYADRLQTTSLLPGVGRYEGLGLPLQAAYASVLNGLIQDGALDAFPAPLRDLLEANASRITGFAEGRMVLGGQVVTGVPDFDPVKETITNTVELGYKGVIGNRLLVSVDAYYTRKEDFISRGIRITPDVRVPGVADDLRDAVASTFTDAELADFGLDRATLAALFAEAGAGLASRSIGLVETEENYDPTTKPEALITFTNFGDIDFFGADVAAHFLIHDQLSLFANYSWVSDNFFDDEDLGEPGTGLETSMNAPKHKATGGFQYRGRNNLSISATGRYIGDFEVSSGVRQGFVDDYFLLDVSAGFDFADYVPGLRLDVTAQNLFDTEHRQYVGAPRIGRLVLARLTYSW